MSRSIVLMIANKILFVPIHFIGFGIIIVFMIGNITQATEISVYTGKPIPMKFDRMTKTKLQSMSNKDQIRFCTKDRHLISIPNSYLLGSNLCQKIRIIEKQKKLEKQEKETTTTTTNVIPGSKDAGNPFPTKYTKQHTKHTKQHKR